MNVKSSSDHLIRNDWAHIEIISDFGIFLFQKLLRSLVKLRLWALLVRRNIWDTHFVVMQIIPWLPRRFAGRQRLHLCLSCEMKAALRRVATGPLSRLHFLSPCLTFSPIRSDEANYSSPAHSSRYLPSRNTHVWSKTNSLCSDFMRKLMVFHIVLRVSGVCAEVRRWGSCGAVSMQTASSPSETQSTNHEFSWVEEQKCSDTWLDSKPEHLASPHVSKPTDFILIGYIPQYWTLTIVTQTTANTLQICLHCRAHLYVLRKAQHMQQ